MRLPRSPPRTRSARSRSGGSPTRHPPLTAGEIAAEQGNPTADLIAAWLSLRLSVPVSRTVSGGPGITEAAFTTPDGDIKITRFDGRTATLAWPGQIARTVALHRRDTAELL